MTAAQLCRMALRLAPGLEGGVIHRAPCGCCALGSVVTARKPAGGVAPWAERFVALEGPQGAPLSFYETTRADSGDLVAPAGAQLTVAVRS